MLVCALVVSACATDPVWRPAEPASSAGLDGSASPPGLEAPPRKILADAKEALRRGDGAYDLLVRVSGRDSPVVRERVVFDLREEIFDLVRTIRTTEDDISLRVRTRRDERYLQVEGASDWNGCWVRFDDSTTAELLGLDFSKVPSIPSGAVLFLDARLHKRNRPASHSPTGGAVTISPASAGSADPVLETRLPVTVDLITALQAFGVTARVLLDLPDDAAQVRVPVLLSVDRDGDPADIHLEGGRLVQSAGAADVELEDGLRAFLPHAQATVRFEEPGAPVEFLPPDPELVVRPGAAPPAACAG